MPTKFRDLDKMLRAAGLGFRSRDGIHYIYNHPTKGTVTVPYHGDNKELKPGTLKAILRKTGLK